jgi:PhnB protein
MVSNPPEGFPRISPYLLYEDATAALDWLIRVFGFEEISRLAGEDGTVMHAEVHRVRSTRAPGARETCR